MRKKEYPSDVSRVRFQQIRPLLEGVRRRIKLRTVDLYEVFCAVLYLLESDCQVVGAAKGVSQIAHGTVLLCNVERARP
jgi:hypothetical protein